MKLSPLHFYLRGGIKSNAVFWYQQVDGVEFVKTEFVLKLIPDVIFYRPVYSKWNNYNKMKTRQWWRASGYPLNDPAPSGEASA
jgi:hypothetical protein